MGGVATGWWEHDEMPLLETEVEWWELAKATPGEMEEGLWEREVGWPAVWSERGEEWQGHAAREAM
jgi:hypothetical protein